MSLNQAQLIGNVGMTPEVRYTQAGKAVANFSVATSETWKDADGERHEEVEWHQVVCFGKVAEAVREHLEKGRQVFVQGKLRTEKWTDKDGIDRYTTKVYAETVQFLGSKPKDDPAPAGEKAGKPSSKGRESGNRGGSRRADD